MTEDAFLSALHENPSDEVTWLALTDWFEEQGQHDRAQLIRLYRRLLVTPWHDPTGQRTELERGVNELLALGIKPVVAEIINSIGMRFALIPPGTFLMGSPEDELERYDDEQQHEVELTRPFYLGVFTVTQTQFQAVMDHNPSDFSADGPEDDEVEGLDTSDFPVDSISYGMALEFCEVLSRLPKEKRAKRVYRLPTEAQWEFACRAGTSTMFHYGNDLTTEMANFDHALGRPCPVGSYVPNAFGLYDMHGNIEEWCLDWFSEDYYTTCPRQDPPALDELDSRAGRVMRGGAYGDDVRFLRSAFRNYCDPEREMDDSGFRIICEWNPPKPRRTRSRKAKG